MAKARKASESSRAEETEAVRWIIEEAVELWRIHSEMGIAWLGVEAVEGMYLALPKPFQALVYRYLNSIGMVAEYKRTTGDPTPVKVFLELVGHGVYGCDLANRPRTGAYGCG